MNIKAKNTLILKIMKEDLKMVKEGYLNKKDLPSKKDYEELNFYFLMQTYKGYF